MEWWSSTTVVLLLLTFSRLTDAQELNGAVRLTDGTTSNCGRVEVFYGGEWGTICDDNWTERDATVICKQLGYERGVQSFNEIEFGSCLGPIWLEDLSCSEFDNSVMDCSHNGWGMHNCTREDSVDVCCDPRPLSLPVRLTCPKCCNGTSCKTCPDKLHPDPSDCQAQETVAGIVEVQVGGVWGPISADGWDINEATVVCGQLGYPISFPSGASPPTVDDVCPNYTELFHPNTLGSGGDIVAVSGDECQQSNSEELLQLRQSFCHSFLQGLECSGRESQLLDCTMSGVEPQPNPSCRVAAVRCGFKPHYKCLPKQQRTYRTRGGAVPWCGRAEVKKNGEWGTICDDGFDALEGNIMCRRLGYGTVKTITGPGGYGRGAGKIHFTQIRCTGTEDRIEDCASTMGTQAEQCGHARDVGFECNTPDTSQCSNDTLYNVGMKEDGDHTYPVIRGESGWGVLCYNDTTPVVTREVGEVICRQTRRQFLTRISKTRRLTNYGGVQYNGTIHCTGTKLLLSECKVKLTSQSSCPGGYTTIECTSALADIVPDVDKLKSSLESFNAIQVHSMDSLQCAYEEGCLSPSATPRGNPRTVLRFDSLAWNWGLADFEPTAPRRDWQWHSCHNHYHSMEEFAHYNLLYASSQRKAAEGHKASFCLLDSRCSGGRRRHTDCYFGKQGISPNCGDLYGKTLECQWIDITGVPLGEYVLQVSLNPLRFGLESDYKNNQASCRIEIVEIYDRYTGRWQDRVQVRKCWLSDH
jgi:lysyl oxidase-like protein 2/3/4